MSNEIDLLEFAELLTSPMYVDRVDWRSIEEKGLDEQTGAFWHWKGYEVVLSQGRFQIFKWAADPDEAYLAKLVREEVALDSVAGWQGERFQILREVYSSARNAALRVGETLQGMRQELEKLAAKDSPHVD